MTKKHDIYLLGLSINRIERLISFLDSKYNLKIIQSNEQNIEFSSDTILIIFDNNFKDQFTKLLSKAQKIGLSTIAYIDSSVETAEIKIELLEAGVEDIITGEMSLDEQLARVKCITRSFLKTEWKIIKHSGISLNKRLCLASFKNNSLDLTRIEFDILYMLFENFNKLTSRERLTQQIWGKEKVCFFDTHIANIRRKILETPVEIVARRGQGIKVSLKR